MNVHRLCFDYFPGPFDDMAHIYTAARHDDCNVDYFNINSN